MKWLATLTISSMFTLCGASLVWAQQPPSSAEATRIEALVTKAASKVEAEGRAAFPEMRKKDSEWFSGSLYVFMYDPNGTVILQPAFPEREGKSFHGEKDRNGKPFHDEIL